MCQTFVASVATLSEMLGLVRCTRKWEGGREWGTLLGLAFLEYWVVTLCWTRSI